MLLPVKRGCISDMNLISSFALDILKFVEAEGNNSFNEEKFLSHFKASGEWFLKRLKDEDGKVQKGLKKLYELTECERSVVREAFEHDIIFAKNFGVDFEFLSRKLEKHVLQIVKDFLIPFYDNIFVKSGFRDIKGLDPNNIPFTRKTFLQHYKRANPETYQLCPACLSELKLLVKRGAEEIPVADVDHYLPKSLYPILVISPENLIPVCSDCNQRLKGSKNPIDETKSRLLSGIFFPYHDPGLDQIQIEFSIKKASLIVKPKNLKDGIIQTKINNMERIFKTSQVWSGSFKIIHKELFQRAKLKFSKNKITDKDLRVFLEFEKEVSADGLYTIPRSFIMMSYCDWLLNNDKDFQILKNSLFAI